MRRWAWLILIVVLVSVWRFGPPHYTIEPDYTDHLAHEYAAWAFTQIGFDVFSTPLTDWGVEARHHHILWETLPHMKPAGSVIAFLPFGAAANLGVSDYAVHWLMSVLLGLGGVWAAVVFSRTVTVMRVFLTVIVGATFVYWGLNGFTDPLVAGCAIMGVRQYRRDGRAEAILWLVAASSLHYRVWYLAPLLLVAMWGWRRFDWRFAVAGVVGVLSVVSFMLSVPALGAMSESVGSAPSLSDRLSGWGWFALAAGLLLAVGVGWLERSLLVGGVLGLLVVVLALTPQWHAWYPILITPVFGLVQHEKSQALLTVGWLQLLLLAVVDPVGMIVNYLRAVG